MSFMYGVLTASERTGPAGVCIVILPVCDMRARDPFVVTVNMFWWLSGFMDECVVGMWVGVTALSKMNCDVPALFK